MAKKEKQKGREGGKARACGRSFLSVPHNLRPGFWFLTWIFSTRRTVLAARMHRDVILGPRLSVHGCVEETSQCGDDQIGPVRRAYSVKGVSGCDASLFGTECEERKKLFEGTFVLLLE
ncbi:hypothetical protein Naga_101627g2 [Nannochloropsis gaditana]|uniref:Uncharacterized protein n=1 Tax=Nannochloropsis gaditana TaxID=72520 RepID=W7TJ39_9STRA|nr:hypothetical protein Naga_101627g2 [Nannochloropsis gaditana]